MNRRRFLITTSLAIGAVGIGALHWKSRWKYIVIHHSAGDYGDIEFLQQVHRERQAGDPIDAIPYHYVIGNGNGLGDGEVAHDWRLEYDIWGAHVSANNIDRNYRGLGICLIGNFENRTVTPNQYAALLKLTKTLMNRYGIEKENVTGHGNTPGESTKCPGKNFPMDQFMKELV